MKVAAVYYTSVFVKHFKKLPRNIQDIAVEKEKLFRANPLAPSLKTHQLTGKLSGYYSFSITYHYRIMFMFEVDGSVTFIDVGSHSIYQ